MLWYRAWLETRYRFLIALAALTLFVVPLRSLPVGNANSISAATISAAYCIAWLGILLAGAGITTQTGRRGHSGSALFTLALPVSRLRLIPVRATLGWLELMAGLGFMCGAMWTLLPIVRSAVRPADMLAYALTVLVCASGVYSICVLLAAIFDDMWRFYVGMMVLAALAWIPSRIRVPDAMNIFGAVAGRSPLVTHAISWISLAFSLELAAILMFAAVRVAQRREY